MALSNARIINGLDKYLSDNFKSRIPAITQANMNQIADTITEYPTLANEFINVLTNQVIRTMFFTRTIDNPLAFFEKGDLSKFGKSLEMIYVDVIKGKDFTERFGLNYENEYLAPEAMNNVKVQYLTENSRLKYKITISNDMLASAFRNENGLSQLVNQLVSKMSESYNLDKFLMTWRLLDVMPTKIMQGNATLESKADFEKFLIQIKTIIKNMNFPSNMYNEAGVWTKSSAKDLAIIMDTNTVAKIDVQLLAGVFNLSKVEMASRIVEVPYFGHDGVQAIICDRDKLQIFSTKYATDTVRNGAGLFTNIFLHRWDLFGACDFANCVTLTKDGNSKGTARKSMPYDVMHLDEKDENGVVKLDLTETTLEIDSNGEIKSKSDKKVKPAKKKAE